MGARFAGSVKKAEVQRPSTDQCPLRGFRKKAEVQRPSTDQCPLRGFRKKSRGAEAPRLIYFFITLTSLSSICDAGLSSIFPIDSTKVMSGLLSLS